MAISSQRFSTVSHWGSAKPSLMYKDISHSLNVKLRIKHTDYSNINRCLCINITMTTFLCSCHLLRALKKRIVRCLLSYVGSVWHCGNVVVTAASIVAAIVYALMLSLWLIYSTCSLCTEKKGNCQGHSFNFHGGDDVYEVTEQWKEAVEFNPLGCSDFV